MEESLSLPIRLGEEESVEMERHSSGTRQIVRSVSVTLESAGKKDRKNTENSRQFERLVKQLTNENRDLEKKIQELEQKHNEESRRQIDYISSLVQQNEMLTKEIRRCTEREQELKDGIESCRRALRAEQSKNDMLAKDCDRVVAEKAAVVRILKKQSEDFMTKLDYLKGQNRHLEGQVQVNRVAHDACMEFGYSSAMVMDACLKLTRRYGYRAADLMEILMEEEERRNLPPRGHIQVVSEERQYRQETGQMTQLEGAVGGQDPARLHMDLLEDVNASASNTQAGGDNGMVAPSCSSYREQS